MQLARSQLSGSRETVDMSQETFQLAGNATEIHEDQKVPEIFGPLAEATLDLVSLSSDNAILDVACGTGIMARKVRQRVGPAARIAGVNLNDADSRSCEGSPI